ncbi:uncharacterized protein LOC125665758 [Ostrea edulis]|uniref:uncharacterized protein LOC125665758 n=1 Tax=Ostrea edulis TaxID=37623 RepID=UPI0024AFE982|nr:uncharacterized protein LOC125665758 [Ostrea edulis]
MILEQWKISGFVEIPSMLSSTSLPQQWDKPRGDKIQPEPVSQMIISNPSNLNRKRKPIVASFVDTRKTEISEMDMEILKKFKQAPISYLVSTAAGPTVDTPFGAHYIGSPLSYHAPLILPITKPRAAENCGSTVFPKALHTCVDLECIQNLTHEWTELNLTQSDAINLEKSTRSQSLNQIWHTERSKRITASNFGLIIRRKKDVNQKFLKNTFQKNDFTSSATSYGKVNEHIAKQMYIKKTGHHLHDIGLIVNTELPFLGATPDGIVCDKSESGLIEIKCPYSVRDKTISEACETRNDFFLQRNGNTFSLKHEHSHWYQVQGQLLVTGAPFCDFITYTKQDLYVERVYPNKSTMDVLVQKLAKFYVQHFKPFIHKCDSDLHV